MTRALLEIIALGPADAAAAESGGADRLEVVASMDADGLSPEPRVIAGIRRETDLPLRVMLRLDEGFTTSPSDLNRLTLLAEEYAEAGANGFVFGFLTPTLDVDGEATLALAERLPELPWTYHRAVDHVLDADQAWRVLRELPAYGLDAVLTAGSVRGVGSGVDDLVERARTDPAAAELIMAGGGLRAEHVPWLAQAGVRAFHVGSAVRPDGSWKAYVDAAYVRSWKTLADEEVARAADLRG
jgi:copper homeostasis protein